MDANETQTKESQRKHVRYAVSDDCRLRAAIKLQSSDPETAKKDWPGTLVDMSSGGAHIQISMGAVAYKGDSCVLKLSLGTMKTEVRGTLAHYVCSARYSVCGLKFDHSVNQGYEPLFKAVVASSTLKAGETATEAGRYREEYRGPGHTKLVVWRDNKPERAVVAFDYVIARYAAALTGAGPDMFKNKSEVAFRAAPGDNRNTGALGRDQEAEARLEFSVAASNLPKTIPPDIRRFLRLVS